MNRWKRVRPNGSDEPVQATPKGPVGSAQAYPESPAGSAQTSSESPSGSAEPCLKKTAKVARIPLYHRFSAIDFPFSEPPDDYLMLSEPFAHGAEVAVIYSDDIVNPYLHGAYLLLKKHRAGDPLVFGNMYVVRFCGIQLIRIVKRYERNPELITLTTLRPSLLSDLEIDLEEVTGLWRVVGALCNLVR